MISKLWTRLLERIHPLHVLAISDGHATLARKHRDGSVTVLACLQITERTVLPIPPRTVVIYERP